MIAINFIVVLGILIFVHELGHFLVAKLLGIKVEKFSLGFGPKLLGYKWGETEYLLSALPLGGYVKMLGEGGFVEGAESRHHEEDNLPSEAPLADSEKGRSFAHRPPWQRMAVIIAGPAFNLVFAWLLLISLYLIGIPMMKATIGDVFKDKPAAAAGLLKGDLITSVNGQKVLQWDDFSSAIASSKSEIRLSVTRGGQNLIITVVPEVSDSKTIFGEAIKKPLIGVAPAYDFSTERFGLIEAIKLGNAKSYEVTKLTVVSMVKLFQGVVPLKTVGGPLMIADMANKAANIGGSTFLMLLAVVSINLGILNLLPVPVLDGGHLMFISIEMAIRRPVPLKVREFAQQAGLVLLIGLMVLAFYNDISRYFFAQG